MVRFSQLQHLSDELCRQCNATSYTYNNQTQSNSFLFSSLRQFNGSRPHMHNSNKPNPRKNLRRERERERENLSENVVGAERALLDFPVNRNRSPVREVTAGDDSFAVEDRIAGCMIRRLPVLRLLLAAAGLAAQRVVGARRISHSSLGGAVGIEQAAGGAAVPPPHQRPVEIRAALNGGAVATAGYQTFRHIGDRHRRRATNFSLSPRKTGTVRKTIYSLDVKDCDSVLFIVYSNINNYSIIIKIFIIYYLIIII